MAGLSVNGLEELMFSLEEIMELPDGMALEMLEAEAKIVEEAQVYQGMKEGVYDTGTTLCSIGHGKMKRTQNGGRVMYVYPQGTRERGEKKVRNAEVAFINEYGTRTLEPRQFIRKANELAADAAVQAAAQIYGAFLDSKGL